jgi:hypothetical protein
VLTFTVRGVKRVVKVRMLPTKDQAVAMDTTLRTCSDAASWLSAAMHADRIRGKHNHNAALVIAARGAERWGEVMRPHAAPTLTAG